jgi:hypothetical protein
VTAARRKVEKFDDLFEGAVVVAIACRYCGGEHVLTLQRLVKNARTYVSGALQKPQRVWVAETNPHVIKGVAEAGFGVAEENIERGTIYYA